MKENGKLKMSGSRLPAVLVIGVALAAGCSGKVADAPATKPSMTTEQLFKTNPQFHQQIMSRLEYQIEHSNLPADEKQRQIAKLRAEGPPQ